MAIIDEVQFLERAQFFNGQRLFAPDLQGLESFNREMRWLHNQSLHQPGVGSGYKVIGNKDDREVTISAGYALDSVGREIVLTETLLLPIPPVADNGAGESVFFYLTVSYPDDSELVPSETRAGVCSPPGVIRLREQPVFCWVRLSDDQRNPQPVDLNLKERIKKQLFIVLARAEIFNCKLKYPISTTQRRSARPPTQPRIACGTYPVEWQILPPDPVHLELGMNFVPATLTGRVDTTVGGFAATPHYLARLAGDRERNAQPTPTSPPTSPPPPSFRAVLDGFLEIATLPAPTATSFFVNLYPMVVNFGNGSADVGSDLLLGLKVTWFGVEA